MTQASQPSLNEQIAEAETVQDVHLLLAKGRTFQKATNRSINRWNRTAKRRIAQLQTVKFEDNGR